MLQAKQAYEKTPTKKLEKEIARCNNIQMAKKISLNSAYASIKISILGTTNLPMQKQLQLSGQVSIRWIEMRVNKYLNNLLNTEDVDYVIASDTDSIYINFGPLADKFFSNKLSNKIETVEIINKICEDKLEPFIDPLIKILHRM